MHNERIRVMEGETNDNEAVVIKNLSKVCMNIILINNKSGVCWSDLRKSVYTLWKHSPTCLCYVYDS